MKNIHTIDWYKLDNTLIKLNLLELRHQYHTISSNLRLEQSEANYFKKFECMRKINALVKKYNSNMRKISNNSTPLKFDDVLNFSPSFFID